MLSALRHALSAGRETELGRAGGGSSLWHRPNAKFYCSGGPEPGVDSAPPAPHPTAPSWARGGDRGAVLGAGGAGGFPSLPAEEEEEEEEMPRR